ncbi:MAG: hypothetical protein QM704_24375 [Anaeromyxobacteraceae bacterium]
MTPFRSVSLSRLAAAGLALSLSAVPAAADDRDHRGGPRAVPVVVQNTVPVTVQGTVKVEGGGTAAAAVQPVQGQSTCTQECSATPFADVTLYTVPAGKRLVIEHVSGYVMLAAGAAASYSLKVANAGSHLGGAPYPGVAIDHMLVPVSQTGEIHTVGSAVHLRADPGTNVVFHVVVNSGTGVVRYVLASFSGYLEDA